MAAMPAAQALRAGGPVGGSARELHAVGQPVTVQGTPVQPVFQWPAQEPVPLPETSMGKVKRRVTAVAVGIAAYSVISSVVQAASLWASLEMVSEKLEGMKFISQDHDVMDVLLRVPTAVVSYSIPGYVCTVMVSLLFTVCGCMAAKGNSGFCASCFCCCNGCNFVFSLIGLISLSVFVTVALNDVDGKLREYLSLCDPVAVCGEDLHGARVVDCLAASAWPKEYTRRFPGSLSLDPKCPHIFLTCNGSDATPYRPTGGDHEDIWQRPVASSTRGKKPLMWWPGSAAERPPERRLAIERASALRRASLSHGSSGQAGGYKPRPMPENPLEQCNVSHAAVIWHGLFEEEPEMVAALRAYFTTRAVLTLPLLALAACGCWYGQELRSKIQIGGWSSGHDQEMMVMVQQPLMVQVPDGLPVQAPQVAAQPVADGLQAEPFVLRLPEALPVAAYPEHE